MWVFSFYIRRMTTGFLIDARAAARRAGRYSLSDKIREHLDNRLSFVFDTKDGPEVHHLTASFFMRKPNHITHRQYLEERISSDIRAEKRFDAWLYSMKHG